MLFWIVLSLGGNRKAGSSQDSRSSFCPVSSNCIPNEAESIFISSNMPESYSLLLPPSFRSAVSRGRVTSGQRCLGLSGTDSIPQTMFPSGKDLKMNNVLPSCLGRWKKKANALALPCFLGLAHRIHLIRIPAPRNRINPLSDRSACEKRLAGSEESWPSGSQWAFGRLALVEHIIDDVSLDGVAGRSLG